MSKSKNNYADLEYKLGEAIKINDSLAREIEQLKWERGSTLVDLREENEQLRMQFYELKELSMKLVDYNYDSEQTHYDETIDEDGVGGKDHIFLTIKWIIKMCKLTKTQYKKL
tara:strand:+ start:383 stop:721 length:339 start_codon:yes stop_codon:yes gene_type:complete